MGTRKSFDFKKFQPIAQELRFVLADTYILYVKTQNFHWNVTDPRFYFLHQFFESQYEELAEDIDELAERIRMLGHPAPGSLSEFLELGRLKEENSRLSADQMIAALLDDHEALIAIIHPVIEKANTIGDEGSGDLLIDHLRFHEKTAWMLRSHLSGKKSR